MRVSKIFRQFKRKIEDDFEEYSDEEVINVEDFDEYESEEEDNRYRTEKGDDYDPFNNNQNKKKAEPKNVYNINFEEKRK